MEFKLYQNHLVEMVHTGSYSHPQGLYNGLALDGKYITATDDCNQDNYKSSITSTEVLGNKIEAPTDDDCGQIIKF